MSELSVEIKSLRLKRKWNQLTAASHCKINPSLFSRLESGKIVTPTLETLAKLAEGFQVDFESLSAFSREGEKQFRVGFAHSIWAAPIVPLVMEGPTLKGIKLTSYGEFQPAESFAYRPHWYDSNAKLFVGPNFGYSNPPDDLPIGYSSWPADSKHSIFTAADLDVLLKNQQIDCLVAAKHVFAAHDSLLLRCARIMDCVGGGAAILIWQENTKYAKALNKIAGQNVIVLPELIKALEKEKLFLPTYYGQGTSAEKTLDFFGPYIGRFTKRPVTLRDWPSVLRQFDSTLSENGGFLFIAWEPFISSVRRKFYKSNKKMITRIHLSDERPMPYISFDIMFTSAEANRWTESDLIKQFLKQIELNIERLKSAIASQHMDADIIRQVASYLNMDRKSCLETLSHIDFGLLYYPEWLNCVT